MVDNRRNGDRKLPQAAPQGSRRVHVECFVPFEDKDFEARRESAGEFDFADRNIVCIDVRDNEKSRFLRGGK